MAYTRTKPQTFQLEGTFLRKLQAVQGTGKTGKPYTQNKFILHTLDGHDVYISKFGDLSSDFIGKDVRFEATKYNDTNFTVVGEIEEAGDLVGALPTPQAPVAQTTAEAPTTRRRGRPAKTEAVVVEQAGTVPSVAKDKVPALTGREAFRGQAEESVISNLQSAIKVVGELGLKGYSVSDLVAVADLLGRTTTAILMDSQKHSR
jgi:hypothetical protein